MMDDGTARMRASRAARATFLAILFATTGCTATRTTIHAQEAAIAAQAEGILVFVDADVKADVDGADTVRRVAVDLGPKIVEEFHRRGMAACLASSPAAAEGSFQFLHVTVQEVHGGNWLRRTAVGFGSGKPSLTIKTALLAPGRPETPLRRLSVEARMRARPGLLVWAGVAAATGVLTPLAVATTATVATDHGGATNRLADVATKELVDKLAI